MSGTYDPRSAAYAIRDMIQRHSPQIKSSNVPGLVTEQGKALDTRPHRPPVEGLCVLVRMLEDGTAQLPDDFDNVERTRAGLKAHVRPDGGVCLGFYGNTPEDATIVYGDPLTSTNQAKHIVLDFWERGRIGAFRPRLTLDTTDTDS